MEQSTNNKKQYIIVGSVILVLLIIIGFTMYRSQKKEEVADKESVFKEGTDAIPTVNSSVQVTIEGNKEAVITVSGIPAGTTQIEYELNYKKKNLIEGEGVQDGVFGRIKVNGKETTASEDITFGTCSSGVCRYHNIDGPVKGIFKFSGSYGQQLLEKEFEV